jgi:hypothetical protein
MAVQVWSAGIDVGKGAIDTAVHGKPDARTGVRFQPIGQKRYLRCHEQATSPSYSLHNRDSLAGVA